MHIASIPPYQDHAVGVFQPDAPRLHIAMTMEHLLILIGFFGMIATLQSVLYLLSI